MLKKIAIALIKIFLVYILHLVSLFLAFKIEFLIVSNKIVCSELSEVLWAIFSFGIGVFLLFLLIRFVERRSIQFLGLEMRGHFKEFFIGCAAGVAVILLVFIILLIIGSIRVAYKPNQFVSVLIGFITLLFLAASEELFFRGYILNCIKDISGKYTAVIVSSIIFSLGHYLNPLSDFNFVSFVNIFLAGIVLGLLFLRTSNLWLVTGFHALWNFTQGIVGLSDSDTSFSIFTICSRNYFFIGNSFVFEGLIVYVLLLLVIAYILVKQENRKAIMRKEGI